jgi:hypothetical protein
MRTARPGTWVALLVLPLVFGCATDDPRPTTSFLGRFRSLWSGVGPDAVQMELAIVRQPSGDAYLAGELWEELDEQVVPLELRPVLQVNGFRVGTLSGGTPARLQTLLTSDATCVEARRKAVKAGTPTFLALGPNQSLNVKVVQDHAPTPLELDRAQCGVSVSLRIEEDGDVLLRFEPHVQHGGEQRVLKPAEDRSDWKIQPSKAEEAFPRLGWEVSLARHEFLVIGGLADRPGTLGHACFFRPDKGTQDILVIRTLKPSPDPATTTAAKPTGPPSLAQQSMALKPSPGQNKD